MAMMPARTTAGSSGQATATWASSAASGSAKVPRDATCCATIAQPSPAASGAGCSQPWAASPVASFSVLVLPQTENPGVAGSTPALSTCLFSIGKHAAASFQNGETGLNSKESRIPQKKPLGIPIPSGYLFFSSNPLTFGSPSKPCAYCAISFRLFKARTRTDLLAGLGSAQIISPVAGLRT